MINPVSRRQILGSTLAAGVAGGLPAAAWAEPAPRRLVAGTAVLDVLGRPAKVFRLQQADGTRGITLAPGERFQVSLENALADRTIIHWHGQTPPWTQDGFPWPEKPALAPGAAAAYDFKPIPGTFWMHAHYGMQEQQLMTAPLIVRRASEVAEDRQEIVLMLNDFSFKEPAEILAGLTRMPPARSGMAASMAADMPAGMGSAMAGSGGMGQGGMASGMASAMAGSGGMGQGGMMPDLNDVDYDAFLANDRTLDDPAIVPVEASGRLRLRIINGSSASAFWIDLGALSGRIVAVDGHGVRPVTRQRLPLAIAQRVDLLIDVPGAGAFPILAQLEGSRRRTGIVLASPGARVRGLPGLAPQSAPPVDNSLEAILTTTEPLAPLPLGQRARILLAGTMQPYHWTINGETWPAIRPLMLAPGKRVEIDMINQSNMAHPMHLHGHAFQVLAINGRPMAGAVRDTVLVEPRGHVRIAFNADNPGRWAFHCHNLYHMMTGMMTEFRYEGIAV